MIRFAIPAALLLALAAPAATSTPAGEKKGSIEAALAGLTPGKPQTCLSRHSIDTIRPYGQELLYVRGRGRVWRNTPVGGCPGLKRDDILVFRTTTGDHCRGDIVEMRSRMGGFVTGICSLGAFVPYAR